MGEFVPGIFLSVLFPLPGENVETVASRVSSFLEWVPEHSPDGYWVHRGVFWAVVVHDVDNVAQNFVIALARDPSIQAWDYMQVRKVPRSIGTQGGSDSHTIYNATDEYKEGRKVAMGHNGPL